MATREAKIRVVVEGLPEGCDRCGAVIGAGLADVHDRWHERVEAALEWVEYEDSEQARRANGG